MSSSERLIKDDLLVLRDSPAVLHAALCADGGRKAAGRPISLQNEIRASFPPRTKIESSPSSQKVKKHPLVTFLILIPPNWKAVLEQDGVFGIGEKSAKNSYPKAVPRRDAENSYPKASQACPNASQGYPKAVPRRDLSQGCPIWDRKQSTIIEMGQDLGTALG